jgi:hypothetical protein
MNERVEGLTAEEELAEVICEGSKFRPMDCNRATRIVDLIKELIDERAEEKADEAIGDHTENYDHDLMYGT